MYFGAIYRSLPSAATGNVSSVPPPKWPEPVTLSQDQWMVFSKSSSSAPGQESPLAKRFRLAGTFFTYSDSGEGGDAGSRRAIIDDVEKNQQYLVSEGQDIDSYNVARIYQDRVVLRSGGVDMELWLSFTDGSAGLAPTATASTEEPAEKVLESSRFGDRVGTNRWVISRDNMLGYYRELLDDPERIASLYLSLKPQYQENQIAGYTLDVEGEGDFFKAVGLQPGDTIRKVNSMNMTSQKRAEYFIGEFVKSRVSAFVLDVDRDGKQEKLIYLIR